jgi:glycosyl transferase family 87
MDAATSPGTRGRRAILAPPVAWLLPPTALFLVAQGARAHPPALPQIWTVTLVVAVTTIATTAWLLAIRSSPVERVVLAIGFVAAVAALFVVVRPVAEHIWPGHSKVHPGPTSLAAAAASLAAAAGWWFGRRRGRGPGPLDLVIGIVLVSFFLTDLVQTHSVFQRDLGIYLDAGRDYRAGLPIYDLSALHVNPSDPTQLPFLYPPVVLPLFAALSALPAPLVSGLWLAGETVAAIAAVRLLGLSWGWVVALVVWPPFVQGVWVGNVAIWMALIFAFVPLLPTLTGLPALFKFQSGLIGLWLIRERKWRALIGAGLLVAGLCLVTLPFVGVRLWEDWYHALRAFQETLRFVPAIQGVPISRAIGELAALGLAAALVIVGFLVRRGTSLATFGLASVAASPTLYLHGLTLALPGFLRFRAAAFWLAILIATTTGLFESLWLVLVFCGIASFVPALRHQPGSWDAPWQPLGDAEEPWAAVPASPAVEGVAWRSILGGDALGGSAADRVTTR